MKIQKPLFESLTIEQLYELYHIIFDALASNSNTNEVRIAIPDTNYSAIDDDNDTLLLTKYMTKYEILDKRCSESAMSVFRDYILAANRCVFDETLEKMPTYLNHGFPVRQIALWRIHNKLKELVEIEGSTVFESCKK